MSARCGDESTNLVAQMNVDGSIDGQATPFRAFGSRLVKDPRFADAGDKLLKQSRAFTFPKSDPAHGCQGLRAAGLCGGTQVRGSLDVEDQLAKSYMTFKSD